MKNFYTWFFIILIILICISTGYYYTIFKPDKSTFSENSKPTEDPLLILNNQLIDLEIKKNFWKNKINLADQDQYNIFIDLSDSLISIDISGITAHTAKIFDFEIADNFKVLRQNEKIVRMFKEPFHLMDEWASIPKNPIRVKDISGFQWDPDSLNFVPTQTDTEHVFVVLKCSRDFSVMISQKEIIENTPSYVKQDKSAMFESIIEKKTGSAEIPFSQLLQKNWIDIQTSRSDVVALFRALTDNSLIVVCF